MGVGHVDATSHNPQTSKENCLKRIFNRHMPSRQLHPFAPMRPSIQLAVHQPTAAALSVPVDAVVVGYEGRMYLEYVVRGTQNSHENV